ncbi:hypothetical protein Cgig2_003784 [Carnegiea gigantea]|uniref:Aminotransferase-like plant mobile domain-containing protein n=1 Tax=Carnegiea gigantea TaxID=171969 RepID=A0A9Q1JTS5_9CARY|nr:hypothetical protein Cgig2_003784 [Carnegiea gigantea]
MQGLFKIVTFMDKTTSGPCYLHIQPNENDADGEETKFPIRNPITSLCKSNCVRGPPSLPWWSKENLKTCKTFLLSTHIKIKKNLPSYQFLHHDREASRPQSSGFPFGFGSATRTRGWGDCQVILDELGVAIGQRTEIFLAAFLSYWLCTFILLVRDASCICSGTFSIASLMASGIGYYFPAAILASIYKGLNELSHSSHPGRSGGHFPAHFLCAWLAKNFDAYELGPKSYFLGDIIYSRGIPLVHFVNGGPRCSSPQLAIHMPVIPRGNEVIYLTRTFQKMKANLIVHFGKPLEPFILLIEDVSSRVKIPGIDVVIPAMPIPAIPIQSIVPLPQDELPVGVCEPSIKKVIELPPEGAENIMDILDAEPNPTACMGESKDVNFKEGLTHVPLPSGSQCFSSIGRIPSFGKLDKTSHQLNTEGAHYEAKTAELKHVESRHQELLKELQLLEDQQKDLNSQVAASEHLLQEAEREVIDLQGQIDILNATEVMDAATKASLEKAEAYIKESFEDLKNFQWDP